MTPYYEAGGITIYHGDCREIFSALTATDLLLADPPYNYKLNYDGYTDDLPRDEYARWCADWFSQYSGLASKTVIFPGNGNLDIWLPIKRPSGIGCWYKPGNPSSSSVGFDEWEPWLYWGVRLGGSSVIRATVSKQGDTGDHPCPKPMALISMLLVKTKATSVIDPFLGSGTTLFAAKKLGIPAIGIEQSEKYCEIAANRLSQEVMELV